jgi:hypothetical protein
MRGAKGLLAAMAFLHGLAGTELSGQDLDCCDPDYVVSTTVRAANPEWIE